MKHTTAGFVIALAVLVSFLIVLRFAVDRHGLSIEASATRPGIESGAQEPEAPSHLAPAVPRVRIEAAHEHDEAPIPARPVRREGVEAGILSRLRDEIARADGSEIAGALRELSGIDEEELKRRGIEWRTFANRLLDAAVRDTRLDPERDGNESIEGMILFSSSADAADGPLRPTRAFATTDVRILAWVPAHSVASTEARLLVRWVNLTTGELLLMRHLYLPPDRGAGYRPVALRRTEGWEPGRYRVEVFVLDADLEPAASGGFEVRGDPGDLAEATSSLELFASDPEEAPAPPLDGVPAGTRDLVLATRVASPAGFTGFVALRQASAQASEVAEVLRGDGTWRAARFHDDAGLPAGLYTAEVRLAGLVLERTVFRVLERDSR